MSNNTKISSHYGKGGRLANSADPLLINSAYLHDCEDGKILLPYLAKANIAHLLVLHKGGIISKGITKSLLRALQKMSNWPIHHYRIDPSNGDIYNNFDVELRELVGNKSGWLHAGRPRREAVNVAFLLSLRESVISSIRASIDLFEALIQKCINNMGTIMPDFTYLKHAQPTNLAHYLMTFIYPLKRDIDRLFELYERVNTSWGESGSTNGSSLPIDKRYFSKLLGYNNISVHCRDAMWQPDLPLESIGAHISLMMNLTRLTDELQIWNTSEFNYVDFPDAFSRASVILSLIHI